MYKVLIVSSAGYVDSNGEIPYLFKKAGCAVDVFCHKSSWLLSNRYHDRWIDAGEAHDAQFADKLIQRITQDPDYYDKIVMTEDVTNKLMDTAIQDPVLFRKILSLTKMENRRILSSKAGLSIILDKYQIATPRYFIYDGRQDLAPATQHLRYPVLLKVDHSFGGAGIKLVEKPEALDHAIQQIDNPHNLMIQELITGG